MYWLIFGVFFILSMIVQSVMGKRMSTYSKEFLPSGLTGREIAEKMLHENGIYDVQVTCIKGHLTDHYNPVNKTLNLSEGVYNGSSVASAAVAAHECGHAVQHAESYAWLGLRSAMVPAVNIGGTLSTWVILGGLLLMSFLQNSQIGLYVAAVGVGLFALTTIFSFVTLPVEFNASKRALAWLERSGEVNEIGHQHAKDALSWAARTYVVAALASLASLLYYVSLINRD
ncbi:MAG: zinc metallopeptidase [Bacteroidales bacterium]|nr:zinc metallopeptidase [Bacteroidales bacterium]